MQRSRDPSLADGFATPSAGDLLTAPEEAPRATARIFRLVERGLLVAGIVLLVVLVQKLGLRHVWHDLQSVGYGFIFILGQELLAYIANAAGWYAAFTPPRPHIPARRLLAVRIAGDVINTLTPTATVGGEFVRARMLQGQVDATALWSSLAVAKVSQPVGQIVFVVLGLLIVLDDTPLPAGFRNGFFAGLCLLVAGVTAAVIVQRRGMLSAGLNVLQRFGVRISARTAERLQQVDTEIRRFYAQPLPFVLSAGAFFVGWSVGVVEIYLILRFLDVPGTSWHMALAIEVLSVAIDGLLFFVPAKAGTQEGGKVLIFSLLGLPPAKGLSLGIIRRLRDLSWSAIGLLILSRYQWRSRTAQP